MNSVTLLQETELATDLQAGSDLAFDYLLTYYHSSVYSLVYEILSDAGDAANVTQEVFLRVFRGIRGFRQSYSLKTLIYRVAVQQALKHQRRSLSRRRQSATGGEKAGSLEALEFQNGEGNFVRRALALVPIQFRSAVILRDVEGLSYEEIAEVLELSVRTVKSRILRGRRILKELLHCP